MINAMKEIAVDDFGTGYWNYKSSNSSSKKFKTKAAHELEIILKEGFKIK